MKPTHIGMKIVALVTLITFAFSNSISYSGSPNILPLTKIAADDSLVRPAPIAGSPAALSELRRMTEIGSERPDVRGEKPLVLNGVSATEYGGSVLRRRSELRAEGSDQEEPKWDASAIQELIRQISEAGAGKETSDYALDEEVAPQVFASLQKTHTRGDADRLILKSRDLAENELHDRFVSNVLSLLHAFIASSFGLFREETVEKLLDSAASAFETLNILVQIGYPLSTRTIPRGTSQSTLKNSTLKNMEAVRQLAAPIVEALRTGRTLTSAQHLQIELGGILDRGPAEDVEAIMKGIFAWEQLVNLRHPYAERALQYYEFCMADWARMSRSELRAFDNQTFWRQFEAVFATLTDLAYNQTTQQSAASAAVLSPLLKLGQIRGTLDPKDFANIRLKLNEVLKDLDDFLSHLGSPQLIVFAMQGTIESHLKLEMNFSDFLNQVRAVREEINSIIQSLPRSELRADDEALFGGKAWPTDERASIRKAVEEIREFVRSGTMTKEGAVQFLARLGFSREIAGVAYAVASKSELRIAFRDLNGAKGFSPKAEGALNRVLAKNQEAEAAHASSLALFRLAAQADPIQATEAQLTLHDLGGEPQVLANVLGLIQKAEGMKQIVLVESEAVAEQVMTFVSEELNLDRKQLVVIFEAVAIKDAVALKHFLVSQPNLKVVEVFGLRDGADLGVYKRLASLLREAKVDITLKPRFFDNVKAFLSFRGLVEKMTTDEAVREKTAMSA